jgi:hypothetical protein
VRDRITAIGALFGGILLAAVFGVLRLVGAIDWAPIWIAMPLIIDVVLWIGTARSLIVMDHILAKAMAKAGMPLDKEGQP